MLSSMWIDRVLEEFSIEKIAAYTQTAPRSVSRWRAKKTHPDVRSMIALSRLAEEYGIPHNVDMAQIVQILPYEKREEIYDWLNQNKREKEQQYPTMSDPTNKDVRYHHPFLSLASGHLAKKRWHDIIELVCAWRAAPEWAAVREGTKGRALNLLGIAHNRQVEYSKAIEVLKQACEYAIGVEDKRCEVNVKCALSVSYRRKPDKGQPDRPAELLSECLALAPNDPFVTYNIASYDCEQGAPIDEIDRRVKCLQTQCPSLDDPNH